jgi:hypothetical protein
LREWRTAQVAAARAIGRKRVRGHERIAAAIDIACRRKAAVDSLRVCVRRRGERRTSRAACGRILHSSPHWAAM